jgi:hypothetical protein
VSWLREEWRRVVWWLIALAAWLIVIVASEALFGRRAPRLVLLSAATLALSVHLTALIVRRSLPATVKAILSVPLLYVRELAPLLLPLIVVLVFMSRGLPMLLQLTLGPALLAVAWVIVAADLEGAYRVLRDLPHLVRWIFTTAEGKRVRRLTIAVLIIAVALIVAFNHAINKPHVYGVAADLEGGTAVAIVFALGLWLIAFILAALGTGTTRTRLLISALLIALVLRFGSAAGVLPLWGRLWSHLGGDTLWLLIGLALPLAAGVAESIIAGRNGRPLNVIEIPPWAAVARYASFAGALLAALILAGASGWGLVETNASTVERPTTATGEPITPASPPTPTATFAAGDARAPQLVALAARFSPVLDLSQSEKYGPLSVNDFLSRNRLSLIVTTSISKAGAAYEALTVPAWAEKETSAGTGGQPDVAPKPEQRLVDDATVADLTGGACRKRGFCTLACPDPKQFCVQRQPAPNPLPAQGSRLGFAYAHIVSNHGQPLTGPSPWKTSDGEQPIAVIEYWLFYPYDYSETFTPVGILTQQHESDWEFVAVGLAAEHPLFVAYSAHCGGTWVNWNDAFVQPPTNPNAERSTHPLIAVALGSHANYRDGRQSRPPDWSSCKGNISGEATWALSYAASIRDRTEHGGSWIDIPDIELVDGEQNSPVYFAGYWGRSDVTRLRNLRDDLPPIYRANHGPTSPPDHASWHHPLTTIFCSGHWTDQNGDKDWPGKEQACANATVGG